MKEKCISCYQQVRPVRAIAALTFYDVSDKNKLSKQWSLTCQVSPRLFPHDHNGICLQTHRLSHRFHKAHFPGETSFLFHCFKTTLTQRLKPAFDCNLLDSKRRKVKASGEV